MRLRGCFLGGGGSEGRFRVSGLGFRVSGCLASGSAGSRGFKGLRGFREPASHLRRCALGLRGFKGSPVWVGGSGLIAA